MNNFLVNNLIERIKSYDWRDIFNEKFGYTYDTSPVKEEVVEEPKPLKYKFPVEVEGNVYPDMKTAAQKTGINYHTLRDYISRRRTPKVDCRKIQQ